MSVTASAAAACPVCIEDYKGKKVVKVTCQYCECHACRGCQQRYLLESYEDPHCMECRRGWSADFISANFPLTFRKGDLRKHRRKILYEREKATLPAMQIYVEHKKRMLEAKADLERFRAVQYEPAGKDYDTIKHKRDVIMTKLYKCKAALEGEKELLQTTAQGPAYNDLLKRIQELRLQKKEAQKEYDEINEAFHKSWAHYKDVAETHGTFWTNYMRLEFLYEGGDLGGAQAQQSQRREFVMKCQDEGCRGFLSTAYKCGTCAKWTCPDCFEVLGETKNENHICKKEDVESAKAIKAETRPCPKCGTRIFKLEGCDMMWCTIEGCNTAFSWNTGHISTGAIHNPHYYEWLRRNGGATGPLREVNDIPCGGLPGAHTTVHATTILTNLVPFEILNELIEIHRNIRDLTEARLPNFPARPPAGMNKEHDVRYLMKELDEAEWMRQLELSETRFNRKKEIGQILYMLCTTAADYYRDFATRYTEVREARRRMPTNTPEYDQILMDFAKWVQNTFIPQLEGLRNFANESLQALGKREKMAVPQVGENWKWIPVRALYKNKSGAARAGSAAASEGTADEEILEVE